MNSMILQSHLRNQIINLLFTIVLLFCGGVDFLEQDRQLIVLISDSIQQVDDFLGGVPF